MTPTTLVTELAAALLVGVLTGCVGVGGVLLPPALVYLGDLGFHAAAATSTWAFLFCGAAGIESQAAGGPGDSRRGPEAELTPPDTSLERFSEHLFADENERRTSETKAARESVEAVLDACFLVRRMTPKTPPPKPISQYKRRAAGSPTREDPGDLLGGKRRYRERSRSRKRAGGGATAGG